jgi:death-on-curing protein
MLGGSIDDDLETLTYIHDRILAVSGGAKGYHDIGLLKSALARPLQSAFGKDAYVGVFEKAAALLDSIANNHGFKDGNKRSAMAAAQYYLYLQKFRVSITNDEYETFMLHVVNDKPVNKAIAIWLEQHSDVL